MAQDLQASFDKVNTVIDAIIDGGAVQEYTINGRNIQKMTLPDLLKWRDRLQREIAAANGNPRVLVKFGQIS